MPVPSREHVIDALNNAVDDNGYTDLPEWPDEDIVLDLRIFDAECENMTDAEVPELIGHIQAWKESRSK
jgi:hypothetical protein